MGFSLTAPVASITTPICYNCSQCNCKCKTKKGPSVGAGILSETKVQPQLESALVEVLAGEIADEAHPEASLRLENPEEAFKSAGMPPLHLLNDFAAVT